MNPPKIQGHSTRSSWSCRTLCLGLHLSLFWLCFGWLWNSSPSPQWSPHSLITDNPGVNPAPRLDDSYILLFGAEKHSAGLDPLSEQFLGEGNVYYNYPSSWKFLSTLGLSQKHRIPFSIALGLCFCAGLWTLLPPISPKSCALHALILFSPPSLNAIGQGNGELLVVGLLCLAIIMALRKTTAHRIAGVILAAMAAMLKLYPAISLAALSIKKRRWNLVAMLALLALCTIFMLKRAEISIVAQRTPKPFATAFGCQLIPARADNLLRSNSTWIATRPELKRVLENVVEHQHLFRLAFGALMLAGFIYGYRKPQSWPAHEENERGALFLIFGACLFLGAFAIGNSWTHRELVLVFVLAGYLQLRKPWLLALSVCVLWSPVLTKGPTFVLEQTLMWGFCLILSRELGSYVFHHLPPLIIRRPVHRF